MPGTLPEYPAPPGNKNMVVKTFAGPVLYGVIGIATPPTGGINILATDLGLTDIEWADVSGSDNGQYGARVIYPSQPQSGVPNVRLQVFTLATGAEIAGIDISGRTFRITAIGH